MNTEKQIKRRPRKPTLEACFDCKGGACATCSIPQPSNFEAVTKPARAPETD